MVLLLISLVLLAPVILGVVFSAVFAAPLLGIVAAAAIPIITLMVLVLSWVIS